MKAELNMTNYQLKGFIAVADVMNINSAATSMGIPLAHLSNQLRMLEDELGLILIDQYGDWLELTEAGRNFYLRAQGILADA